ncbi:putative nuclease HARBI1 isoform X1 [Trichoplusia ni]|uniref:Nuclease HARBI1 isoform X1 n=1 Tax=Trichoplusia ni TaxID=7111 RepID=A0A7E5W9G9_TRINI|nr:putative nuclease HARBI1 isoform X1 [Trichoplusia ni]
MARLAVMYSVSLNFHKKQLKQRRDERRMMRYTEKAFSMNENEFKANYRVSKDLFHEIFENIKPFMQSPKRRSDLLPKYKVLVALSFYATGSYQRLVGGSYGTLMSQQSTSRSIREVTAALNHPLIQRKWIKFPQTRRERDAVKLRFFEKFSIPSVIGCIDGTHIAIIRPSENEERFFNRKHFHSRNVMIVSQYFWLLLNCNSLLMKLVKYLCFIYFQIADSDLRILSVDASFGGASHDSFVWNQHPVKQHLIELNNNGETVFLLGDSGYAQREYMMTPIVDAHQGSPEEYYTKLHCTARNTVERTIGVLKNRWRCLIGHRVLHYHPDVAAKIINACCVLHNMCINRIYFDQDENTAEYGNDYPTVTSQESTSSTAAELRQGIEKRNVLVQQLWASRR